METTIVKESTVVKKYTKKDGTIVQKEYKQRYVVKDNTKKIRIKNIVAKLQETSGDNLTKIEEILK